MSLMDLYNGIYLSTSHCSDSDYAGNTRQRVLYTSEFRRSEEYPRLPQYHSHPYQSSCMQFSQNPERYFLCKNTVAQTGISFCGMINNLSFA